MIRQIKFRVWDNQERRFRTSVEDAHFRDCYLHLTLNGGISAFDKYGDELELESDRFIVQQFTGLKDIYDKEIYEGDIVGAHLSAGYYRTGVVGYDDSVGAFSVFTDLDEMNNGDIGGYIIPFGEEIKGNIFKNSDIELNCIELP